MRKRIPPTLRDIGDNPLMKVILNRSKPIQSVVDELLKHWQYDLDSRRPEAACAGLDMACFMAVLAERGAVINIPVYGRARPKTVREGEYAVSERHRHGKVISLNAHQKTFSFSVRIMDMNVLITYKAEDDVGAYRNFMLVHVDGKWHKGWRSIEFVPTAKENDFLFGLSQGDTITFEYFVHPNRWVAFYGHYYILTKVLIERLYAEAEHYRDESERLLGLGIKLPPGVLKEWPEQIRETGKEIKVKAFEAVVDTPDFVGKFRRVPESAKGLRKAVEARKRLIYTTIPMLRFAVRATELAFFLHGKDGESMPPRFCIRWQRNWREGPRHKKLWSRWEITPEFTLRYRIYEKKEVVA